MTSARDPQKTLQYIDAAQGRFLNISDPVKRTRYAWAWLRGMRRLGDDPKCRELGITPPVVPGAPEDLNLADAEHYMYGKLLAGSTGDPVSKAMVVAYEVKKAASFALNKEKDLRTDRRFPALPPSIEGIQWGLKGTNDGLQQYTHDHKGQYGKLGSAVYENEDLIRDQYGMGKGGP